jgi:nitrogen fixation NifU-like protein
MDLRELYQEVILDHFKHPRNRGRLAEPHRHGQGHNPLCGDEVRIDLHTLDGRVVDVRFDGQGCAISTASASLMTEAVLGKTLEEAEALVAAFQDMVTEVGEGTPHPELGDLEVLAGVREYPVRIKCATLPWHALRAALREGGEVTTE